MKNLILNQIYSTKKNVVTSILLILFFNICQLISILNDGKLDKLEVRPLDFLLKSMVEYILNFYIPIYSVDCCYMYFAINNRKYY
ncbi:hypothetical protein JTT07_08695 [Clostridium botulinum]|nr:hypothetical protein [Clostridium botulinum]MCS4527526.1 hypothetical protein [Clostridium botulinum]